MEIIIILLLISHVVAIFVFKNYMSNYEKNNFNYLNSELKKMDELFLNGTNDIKSNLQVFTKKSEISYKKLLDDQNNFNIEQKSKISELATFIKKDYSSLTNLLKINNIQVSDLVEKTKINLLKNEELKPLLIESSDELGKVYDKIKVFLTNYEKNINDIKKDVESVMNEVEDMANSKIKQIAMSSEQSIEKTVSANKETMDYITNETNNCLSKILKENQINLMAEKFEKLDMHFKKNVISIQNAIEELERKCIDIYKEEEGKNEKKKGFFRL